MYCNLLKTINIRLDKLMSFYLFLHFDFGMECSFAMEWKAIFDIEIACHQLFCFITFACCDAIQSNSFRLKYRRDIMHEYVSTVSTFSLTLNRKGHRKVSSINHVLFGGEGGTMKV